MSTTIALPYTTNKAVLTRIENMVILNAIMYASGTVTLGNSDVNEHIPSGYRPNTTDNAVIQGITSASNNNAFWLEIGDQGSMIGWGSITQNWRYAVHGMWTTNESMPN